MGETSRRIISGIGIGVVVGLLLVALSWRGILDGWEAKTYDWRLGTVAQFDPSRSQVVLFYVDQSSLDSLQNANGLGWPWPRALYADVLRFAKAGGARAVVFDIIYSEDSVYGVADDQAFAEGLRSVDNGTMAVFLSRKIKTPIQDAQRVVAKSAVPTQGGGVPLSDYSGFLALPLPILQQAATGFGNVQLAPDGDSIYRRLPLLFRYQDKFIPSLYLSMLHTEQPTGVAELSPGALKFGTHHIPLDPRGNMILKFYGGVDTFPQVGLAHVLVSAQALKEGAAPALDPAIVKDKVVIVGVSAPGLYDLRPQPLASRFPGAEIHATAFQNILTGDIMRLAPQWTGFATVLLISIVLGILLRLDVPIAVGISAGVIAMGIAVGVPFVWIRHNIWVPMVAPTLAVVATFAVGMVVNFLSEGKKKRILRETFQKYLAPDVVKSLLKNSDAIALGGAEQIVTVYFSDIANFAGITEKMIPSDMVAALNDYLTRCSTIIMNTHGTIDKYIGDAVMAFWGAPLPMANHAEQACRAALQVQKMLVEWNKERTQNGQPPLATRIGIHTGASLVGNMGSVQRMNYTVMGDAVNLASRLEGLNKFFGTPTIASGDSVASLREKLLCRHLAAVKVKGRMGVVEIYELRNEQATTSEAELQFVQQFEKGLAAYRAGRLEEARSIFETLAQAFDDIPSKRYVQWINAAARSPIGSDWDGVITFDSK